jgi:hypothetical protein
MHTQSTGQHMKAILSGIICCLLFWGCKGDPGPASPRLAGNLMGSVMMVDLLNRSIKDQSGVKVILYPNIDSTTSLSDGSWQLNNVPAGIYDVTYAKPGFYTVKAFQFQFVGGGNYSFYPVNMIQFWSGSVTRLSVIDTSTIIRFQGTINADFASGRNVYIFLSKSQFKNSVPIIGIYTFYVSIIAPPNFSYDLSRDYLGNVAVEGDILYAVAVLGGGGNPGINFNSNGQEEFDTEGVPLSNTVSFVVP